MLPILIDENFNQRILRGLQARLSELDYLIAQKTHLLGKADPEVLQYATSQNRVLLTHDLETIPGFAYQRVEQNLSTPGVFAVPDWMPIGQAIEELELLIACGEPAEFDHRVIHFPLKSSTSIF